MDNVMGKKGSITFTADVSSVLDKSYYKEIALYLPATWATAKITFLGCDSINGVFVQVLNASNGSELATPVITGGTAIVICMDEDTRNSLAPIPFIKLQSEDASGNPVSQNGKEVRYTLLR